MEKKENIEMGWNLEHSYATLPKIFFANAKPASAPLPKLVVFNHKLAEALGFNVREIENESLAHLFAGNRLPEGAAPIAQAYAGHQFGHFTMLGDGRAVLLGEQMTPLGERLDIQLKGAGRTKYSRGGDGRAVLGPMLREYIISEAMHGLGIPTTRSLAVVTTGESVVRERFLQGAVLARVASSHIRVGTFQYAATWGKEQDLKALADYTIKRHFSNENIHGNAYVHLLDEVIKRQAMLIAQWQLVGFIHGVMNTDNMAISGETIDYGPCAFMDVYHPSTVFSSIDVHGRYAYGNQPKIALWNLIKFAETLLPLLHENQEQAVEVAQNSISRFNALYEKNWADGMRRKLGLFSKEENDEHLIHELLRIMEKYSADYTNTFIALTFDNMKDTAMFESEEFAQWHTLWKARLEGQKESKEDAHGLMRNNNPTVIPRNHRVEEALDAAENNRDYSKMENLLKVLSSPYEYSKEHEAYAVLPPPSAQPYRTFCGT